MEQLIGLLLVGGSLYVIATLHNDARQQDWSWIARAILYASGIAVLVLSVLITLGSAQAAQIMFVGIGAVLAVIVLVFVIFMLVVGVAALRTRDQDPGVPDHDTPGDDSSDSVP